MLPPVLLNALYGAGAGVLGYGLGGAIGKQFGAEGFGRFVGTANLASRATDGLSMVGLDRLNKEQQKAESIQKEASAAGLVLKGLTGFGKSLSSGVKALKPMAENVLPAAKQSLNKAKMNVTKTPGPHKPGKVLSTLKTNFNKLDSGSQQGLRNVGMTAGIGAAGLGGYAIGQGKQPMSDPVMTLPRMYAR
jgi:hypothetical protein